jgi:hypothetical protein
VNKRDFPTGNTSSDALPDGIFRGSRFCVESFETSSCTISRATNRRRDLSLIKRNDVRSPNFFHNRIEHSQLQVPIVTRFILDPVHVNREGQSEKNDCRAIRCCFSRLLMVSVLSPVFFAMFVISRLYCTVLDTNSVEF